MSDILYIQTEKNVEVQSPEVYLQDVASLSCSNGKVLNRNKARKLFTIPNEKPGRYVISALEIVDLIQRNEESVDVTHIGEANFILTYETQKHAHQFYSWLKTIFVSLVTFFGGAFSIMTFNTDVDTAGFFMSRSPEEFQMEKQFWNYRIQLESDSVLSFSLIILVAERLRKTRLQWK